jgi:hypothetical protein
LQLKSHGYDKGNHRKTVALTTDEQAAIAESFKLVDKAPLKEGDDGRKVDLQGLDTAMESFVKSITP